MVVLGGLVLVALAAGLTLYGPITQPEAYHRFVDTRAWLSVPNAADVLSNLGFVVVGVMGLWRTWVMAKRMRAAGCGRVGVDVAAMDPVCLAVFFTGVLLTGPGSAWYHLAPDNTTLVWDRLPMTVAFAGLVAAVVNDRLAVRASVAAWLLGVLMLLGVFSVMWWHRGEVAAPGQGDLRPYAMVQYGGLLCAVMLAFSPGRMHGRGALALACGLYVLAKVLEGTDGQVWRLTGGLVSGHTLKHAAAACGAGVLVWSLGAKVRAKVAVSNAEKR